MQKDIKIELRQTTVDNLEIFSEMLKKSTNQILEEALEQYFVSEQERLVSKGQNDENAMTNLDYDEFWDGVDFE